MRRLGERARTLVGRVLSPRARRVYWLTLLHLYANRMHQPPDLSRWPQAQRAAAGAHRRRGAGTLPCDMEAAADVLAIGKVVRELEEELGRARRAERPWHTRQRRLPARAPMPAGGDASTPLAFESEVERRTLPPEQDHGAVKRLRQVTANQAGRRRL